MILSCFENKKLKSLTEWPTELKNRKKTLTTYPLNALVTFNKTLQKIFLSRFLHKTLKWFRSAEQDEERKIEKKRCKRYLINVLVYFDKTS